MEFCLISISLIQEQELKYSTFVAELVLKKENDIVFKIKLFESNEPIEKDKDQLRCIYNHAQLLLKEVSLNDQESYSGQVVFSKTSTNSSLKILKEEIIS